MGWYGTMAKCVLAGGVILLGATGCGERQKVAIAAKDETIRRQEELIAQERADKDKLAEANKDLANQNGQLVENTARRDKEVAAQSAETAQKLAMIAAAMKAMDDKIAAVKAKEGVPEGAKSAYDVRADGTIHIIVASTVLFDSGKADLKSSADSMLMNVASTLKKQFPNNYVRVEGHTDSTPVVHNKDKFPDNMALSIARSRAVYDFLIKQGGISANKLYTAGYGEHQPLVWPEKTVADRSKNRRVEIVIMPDNVKVQKDRKDLAQASAPVKKK